MLINCVECGREISDKAEACPGCGAPILDHDSETQSLPTIVTYDENRDLFIGTMPLIMKLAMRAVQEFGWKIDQANDTIGLLTFQTNISWGSWSGVSCSLNFEEVAPNEFRITGSGKQNIRGGQVIAFNIGGEAKSKARKTVQKMKELVPHYNAGA